MRLLDLFCGAGGAAMGYHQAGFDEIVGVDISPQPNYPFTFIQGDALRPPVDLTAFDLIHASPPCQDYSRAMRHLSAPTPALIPETLRLLESSARPWILENVPGAPLPTAPTLFGEYGVELCGSMFELRVRRHRLFQCSFPVTAPSACDHTALAFNHYNQLGRDRIYAEFGRQDPDPLWAAEMGVPWMGKYEAREAIPPAYTKFLSEQFLAQVFERTVR